MSDEFIAGLKERWSREGVKVQLVRLSARRWVWYAHLAADLVGIALLVGSGAVFALFAIRLHDMLFALSAVAMLFVALPLGLAGLRTRWRTLRWEGATPQDVLRSTLARIRSSEQILKLGRWGAYCLLALVVIVWTCAALGVVRHPVGILGFITTSWAVSAIASLWWTRWRLARAARRRAGCEEALRQFEEL